MKNLFDTNNDIYLSLFQIQSTPVGQGLLSPAAVLFNRLIKGPIPKLRRSPILFDHNVACYNALIER